ncbi:phosphate ABC transporter substrate-binding protein [Alkaliflexus imshenetskii]|uniref:phosphate ABC transporter substrate-binding protein n=1 Tax=Alkaliflexus imshenetskii TaxID=286730 RepID=UPI00047D2043|nr:phosphate ABC transporter substrate-binding protein [Alkaliflexus imshenetskii]
MKFGKIMLIGTIALSAILFAACGGRANRSNAIQISGSDSEVNMVQNLAEAYMAINKEQSIAVTGGGSGTGIAAMINRQTDIANSSRAMNASEIQQARDRGVEPVAIPFAIDGLAVIINHELPITEMTIDQISKIYQGIITNWSELGGPDLPITVYGRQSNSGTYVYFRDHVVKADYTNNMRNMNGTAQIVEAVRSDRTAIGYTGIGYIVDKDGKVADRISVINVALDENSTAFSPLLKENVESGDYPISRALYQFTNGMPEGRILEFIRFELSPEGQQIVANAGYYPIGEKYLQQLKEMGIIE